MSGLIKAEDRAAQTEKVRPLGRMAQTAAHVEPAQDAEIAALKREIEALNRALQVRDADVERLRADVTRAFREGEAEGRTAGRAAADQRRAEHLAKLEAGVARAFGTFEEALGGLERLSLLLSSEALAKLLDEPARYAEMVPALVRRQLDQLAAESVVRVEASADDFSDPEELAAFERRIGRPGLAITANPALRAGECRIRLTLGEIEVGPALQWTRLRALFDRLAAQERLA